MVPSQPIDDLRNIGDDGDAGSRESYLRLIDHIPAVITFVDTERRYRFRRSSIAKWLGGIPEDYIGKHVGEALGEESFGVLTNYIDRALAGEQVTFESSMPLSTGRRFLRITYTPDFDQSGNVRGYFGMILDISEQHSAETALQHSEERYRAFIDQSTEGIWRCELREPVSTDIPADEQIELIYKHGFLAECNNAMAAQYGFDSATEIIGAPLDQLLVREDPKNYEFLKAFIDGGYSLTEAESHEKDANGHDVYFLNNFVGFVEDGRLIRAWGTQRDITVRKNAEAALARMAAIVESSDDAIISKDLNGFITSWNKSAERIFGYTAPEIIGKNISILIPPHRIDEEPIILDRIRKGLVVEHYETRRLRKDGTEIDISLTVSPIRNDSGIVIGASKIVRDITDRRASERSLQESQMLLSMAMESSSMGAWEHDIATETVYWSAELEEIFGLEPGSFPGTRTAFYDLIHEDDRQKMWAEVESAVDGHRNYNMEFRFHHADGSVRWMEGRGQAVYSEGGEAVRLYGIGIDVTDRKQAEETLLTAERKAADQYQALLLRIVPLAQTLGKKRDLVSVYRSLLDFVRVSMPCSAFFVSFFDANTDLRSAGYVWGEQGEIDISELPPIRLTADGGPNSQAVFQKRSVVATRYMDMMKTRPHMILQEDGIDPNSSLVVPMIVMDRVVGTLEVQAYEDDAFVDEHLIALEMAANLAAVAIENVNLLKSEIDLRNQAETANLTKDEFLSVLSHELRTPLNSMLGWVRMLRTGTLDPDRTSRAIEVIERNTRVQIALIEDLLDVSRIISGKMRIDREILDIVGLASEIVEAVRPGTQAKSITLRFDANTAPLFINGDSTRLQQVITNLIDNAVKFSPENGKVLISISRDGDSASFIVEDSGIGIDAEFLPYIFDRFSQADASTRRNYTGLGLGLAIVKKIIDLHDGAITVKSDGPGLGAVFSFSIPLAKEFYAEPGSPVIISATGPTLRGARILLVDDDADSLVPLRLFLERENAEVVPVNSAGEALAILATENFNILISDIGMPAMDGYEFISAVRRISNHQNAFVPAIALTAYASADDRRRALSSGFQVHFPKPPDYDELVIAVRELFHRTRE